MKKNFVAVILLSFFSFSLSLFGEESRVKKIIENAELGSPKEKKIALQKCGVERIEKCYWLMINTLKHPRTKIVDEAIGLQNVVAVALSKLRLKRSIEPLKNAVQEISKKIEEQKKLVQDTNKRLILSDIQEAKKTLDKMYMAKSNMILALGSIREKGITNYFIPLLKEENGLIRMTAALCLSFLPDKKNQETLKEALTNEKEETVRLEIIRALLSIDRYNYSYINLFLKMFSSSNIAVRKEAAKIGVQFEIKEGRQIIEEVIALEFVDDVSIEMTKYRDSIFYK